jgi:hypothetical protein
MGPASGAGGTGSSPSSLQSDHSTAECVGLYETKHAHRFGAFEPIRQGFRAAYGSCAALVASGRIVRRDNSSQNVSRHF